MNDTLNQNLGFAHYWAQGDAVSHTVAYVLLLMSIVSWYYILSKTWTSFRIRRSAAVVDSFWDAPTMTDAIALLSHADTEQIYAPLASGMRQSMRSTRPPMGCWGRSCRSCFCWWRSAEHGGGFGSSGVLLSRAAAMG